jgi:hypothetical protein
MVRIWTHRFTAAVILVGIATGLLGYVALRVDPLVLFIAAVAAVPVLVWWVWRT